MGRPSSYTPEIAAEICERMAQGESLTRLCGSGNLPTFQTVFNWLKSRPEFVEQYVRAREAQAERMAHEILQIADDGSNDTYTDNDGKVHVDQDHIQRSKLRVDSRKWLLSKLMPKVYGDATLLKHADSEGNKLQWSESTVNGTDE